MTSAARTARRWQAFVALWVGIVALAGCVPGEAPSASPTDAFSLLVDTYLDDPGAEGYSDEQVATLERAKVAGQLEFEDYSAAIDVSLACIETAGYGVEHSVSDEMRGFPEVSYAYEGPETGNPVAARCIYENSQAVEAIYQLQPSSVEASQIHLQALAAEFENCLNALGIDADFASLKGDELVAEVHHYDSEMLTEAFETGAEPRCMSKASY